MAEWMDGIDKIQAVSSGYTSPAARSEAATELMRKIDRFLGEGPRFWPLAVMYRTGGVPQGEIWTVLWGHEAMGQATELLERLVPPDQRIDPWHDDARWPVVMDSMKLVDVRRCLRLIEESGVAADGYDEAMKIVHEYRETTERLDGSDC